MNYKKQVGEAWDFIKKSRRYFAFVIFLMVFGGVLVEFYSDELIKVIDPFLKDLVGSVSGLSGWGLIVFILQNNLKVAFLGIVLGIAFGIIPIANAFVNGAVIGYVLRITAEKSSILEIWKIFPHGIFELPAIIIALGLGIRLGFSVFSGKRFSDNFYNSMNVLLYIVVPLLIIAAIIEGSLIFFLG